jgi:hypothetical protein
VGNAIQGAIFSGAETGAIAGGLAGFMLVAAQKLGYRKRDKKEPRTANPGNKPPPFFSPR